MTSPTYLLDTNIVSYALDGRHPTITHRIGSLAWADYAISVATRAELMYGIHKVPAPHPAHLLIRRFLGEVQILDWGQDAADAFALLLLQFRKQPVQHLDLMIAAHAMALGATLVTNDVKLIGHVSPWVPIDNWVSEP